MQLEIMVKQLERLQQEMPQMEKHPIIYASMKRQYEVVLSDMAERYGLLSEYQECRNWFVENVV